MPLTILNVARYILNRQPGKALPFYLRLRRPGVFDLIRDNNLFTDVQDQALLLIEFDQDVQRRRSKLRTTTGEKSQDEKTTSEEAGGDYAEDAEKRRLLFPTASKYGAAIDLLVDKTHSIPVRRHRQFSFLSVP
jgi:hypothetical protein